MKKNLIWMLAAIQTLCGAMNVQAQVKYCMRMC